MRECEARVKFISILDKLPPARWCVLSSRDSSTFRLFIEILTCKVHDIKGIPDSAYRSFCFAFCGLGLIDRNVPIVCSGAERSIAGPIDWKGFDVINVRDKLWPCCGGEKTFWLTWWIIRIDNRRIWLAVCSRSSVIAPSSSSSFQTILNSSTSLTRIKSNLPRRRWFIGGPALVQRRFKAYRRSDWWLSRKVEINEIKRR